MNVRLDSGFKKTSWENL